MLWQGFCHSSPQNIAVTLNIKQYDKGRRINKPTGRECLCVYEPSFVARIANEALMGYIKKIQRLPPPLELIAFASQTWNLISNVADFIYLPLSLTIKMSYIEILAILLCFPVKLKIYLIFMFEDVWDFCIPARILKLWELRGSLRKQDELLWWQIWLIIEKINMLIIAGDRSHIVHPRSCLRLDRNRRAVEHEWTLIGN